MYTRLWWKDARQFWPIWGFLVLVALAGEALIVHYGSDDVRDRALGSMAIGFAGLYAFAVGAAAFAGERETGTLRLLDVLPAPRRTVWASKVSFGLVSTLAMMLLLLALATLGAAHPPQVWRIGAVTDPVPLAVMLLQGFAWGLFFSSVLESALVAAILAILMTTITCYATANMYRDPYQVMQVNAFVALALAAFSWVAFLWARRRRFRSFGLELRSPVVVTGIGSSRQAARSSVLPANGEGEPSPTAAAVMAPTHAIGSGRVIPTAAWSADQPRPRSTLTELRRLSRETTREGRWIWRVLMVLGLGVAPSFLTGRDDGPFVVGLGLIALVGGVSVFGLESQRRTYRFLVHHGARPRLVWLAKVTTWLVGTALALAPALTMLAMGIGWHQSPGVVSPWILSALNLALVFAAGLICGMVIPRGITAWTVALVFALALVGVQMGLFATGMIPLWGLAVLPSVLILISWAWCGDWLLERPAPGRWIRLGLLVVAVKMACLAGLAGWRVWSIPDVGPITPPAAWTVATAAPVPSGRNAAELYREAGQLAIEFGKPTGPAGGREPIDLDQHPEALDLIRRAVARPECWFFKPDRITLKDRWEIGPPVDLALALDVHARRRMARGDLTTAWDDVVLLLRMAHQVGQGALGWQGFTALAIERRGLNLAIDWANAGGQTADRLRGAIAAYLALPHVVSPAEVIRAEGTLLERTIDLPHQELKDFLVEEMNEGRNRPPTFEKFLLVDLFTTPWELARVRRLNRLCTARGLESATLEPWQRPNRSDNLGVDVYGPIGQADQFALLRFLQFNAGGFLMRHDEQEAVRRAVVQVLATRAWMIHHDGKFPAKLDDLVPSELSALPLDPFTGQSFGYTTLARSVELPRRDPQHWQSPNWPRATRLIYSAGPDGRGDHGLFIVPGEMHGAKDDLVFPVEPIAVKK